MEKSEKVHFANPIYDVVFRYMMEDNKVAKLFLSAIIGKEIKELVFSPTEYSHKLKGELSITVVRMDFSAKIKEANGAERLIIIELQKAKYYYQTMRFRRYLGKQYQNPENIDANEEPLPILPIYILGESFSNETIPVINIQRDYIDMATKKRILERHPFIEALTHDAIVIQIPHLKDRRKTVLEQFLSIFDQSTQADDKGHILALKEEDYPASYHPVIRRLIKALVSPKIADDMDMEDDVIHEFQKQAEKAEKALEAERKRTKLANQKAETERKKAERERKKADEERKKAEDERKSKEQLIRILADSGKSIQELVKITGLEESVLKNILQK